MPKASRGSLSYLIESIAQRNIGKAKHSSPVEDASCQSRVFKIKEESPDGHKKPINFIKGIRDIQPLMLVPLFTLSKNIDFSKSEKVYPINDNRYIIVQAGPAGFPTIWDYDLMLVIISQFTHQLDEHKAGRRSKPSMSMIMKTADILNFCRRGTGGSQRARLIPAIKRLMGTSIQFFSYHSGHLIREGKPKPLINGFNKISGTEQLIAINIAPWMINLITKNYPKLNVLNIQEQYFDLNATERFLYRFARRAAGAREWEWGFDKIYQRSGSISTRRKFYELLRRAILSNNLPEYEIDERPGKTGPILVMKNRRKLSKIDITHNP